VKAISQGQATDRAGIRAASTDQGDKGQVALDVLRVKAGVKHRQALPVQGNARPQKAPGAAKENHPGVDKLLSFNARHNANNGIIK
jgi:hypothetical protein